MEQRLIDANALYKKLENKYKCANGGLLRFAYKDAIDDVCDAPTIDPVKHGRWIYIYEGPIDRTKFICSNCRYKREIVGFVFEDEGWNYCPVCGAKMDGGTP